MKRITRRNFIKAAGVSVAAVSLAACGETATSSTPTSASTATSSSATSSEAAPTVIGNTNIEGLPIAVEPITYKIMNNRSPSDMSDGQNTKDIVKLTTEGTNVSLEWTETSGSAYPDTLSMMLATGDGLPDAFMSATLSDDQVSGNPQNFYCMTEDDLKTYAPNIYKGMEENVEGGIDNLKKRDGNIYSLPTAVWSEPANWSTAVPYIRKSWLTQLGMEMPKTTDELYDVLVAFKKNCTQNGAAITPVVFCEVNWAAKLSMFAGPWGMAGRNMAYEQWIGRIENGEYKLNITEQRFRDFLAEMNKWRQADLINMDGFSLTNSEYSSLVNGKAFGLYGYWTPTVEDWDNGEWAALPVITAPGYEGQELKAGEYGMRTANMNGFAITSSCKEPQGLLRWWDSCHATAELKRISRDGPEGGSWAYGDDGVAYVQAVDPLPAQCANDTSYQNTYGWRTASAIMFAGESPIPSPDKTSEDGIRYSLAEMYTPYYPKELLPLIPPPSEAVTDFAFVKEEIENLVETFMATSVMKGIDDTTWDKFQNDLKAVGIDEWVTYYQKYVDQAW